MTILLSQYLIIGKSAAPEVLALTCANSILDRGKVGHSSEGLVDSHLGVIEDFTDSGADLKTA